MNLTFRQYCKYLNEKQGVISRVDQNEDVLNISDIANRFMEEISKNNNKEYITYEPMDYDVITIKYHPIDNIYKTCAKTSEERCITIYDKLTDTNYLDIKYMLIHELIHIVQLIRKSHRFEDYTLTDRLRAYLRDSSIDESKQNKNTKYFSYLLYREDLWEIYAWSNDAYIAAFKYKMKNPKVSSHEIMRKVLYDINMDTAFLNNAINTIYTEDAVWDVIIKILFGHFYELGKSNEQIFFDKSIFNLPLIMQIRKMIKNGDSYFNEEDKVEFILQLIEKFKPALNGIKEPIIESFIEHIKYWHKRARIKIGKAIQLGIDDATINNIK